MRCWGLEIPVLEYVLALELLIAANVMARQNPLLSLPLLLHYYHQ